MLAGPAKGKCSLQSAFHEGPPFLLRLIVQSEACSVTRVFSVSQAEALGNDDLRSLTNRLRDEPPPWSETRNLTERREAFRLAQDDLECSSSFEKRSARASMP